MFEFLADKLAEVIAGKPHTARWDYATAIFGWCACAALTLSLLLSFVGLSGLARDAFSVFVPAALIAFNLDWIRLGATKVR